MDAARTANGWPVARRRPGALTSTNRSHVPIFRGEYQRGVLSRAAENVRFAGFAGSYDGSMPDGAHQVRCTTASF